MKLFIYNMRMFDEKAYFEKYCTTNNILYGFTEESPSIDNIDLAEGYDAIDIITTAIDHDMLDAYAKIGVKCIATRTIGFDHVDLKYAKKLGIGVINVSYSPYSVADYTLMMMLMGIRRMKEIILRADVQDYTLRGKMGIELHNCTVGVIGTGRIGTAVVEELQGFGCKIIAYDPYENDRIKELAHYTDLDELLASSDIITLHAPETETNFHLIDESAFSKMKDGVGIVNCARGPLIDDSALINALESRKVGFACLDVLEQEKGLYYVNRMGEPMDNHDMAILRSFPNVIVTPHMAFYTDEAVAGMAIHSIEGIEEFFRSGKCLNPCW